MKWRPSDGGSQNGGRQDGLACFLNLAGSQAAGTNTNTLNGPVFDNLYILEVGIEFSRLNIVSVRNRAAENRAFATNVTLHWHLLYSH